MDNRRGDDGTVVRERREGSSTDVRLLTGGERCPYVRLRKHPVSTP